MKSKTKGYKVLMEESKMIAWVKGPFHFTRLGKTSSWFLSILLTPYHASHKETRHLSKPKPIKNAIVILNLE